MPSQVTKANPDTLSSPPSSRIQDHLLYTLNAHPNNWPTQVQSRALALLRSGEVTTFPVLLKQVLDEVRKETALRPNPNASASTNNNATNAGATNTTTNGADASAASAAANNGSVQVNGGGRNGAHRGPGPGEASNLNRETPSSLAVPASVVEEALRVTSQALREVAEFEEENGAT